MKARSQDDLIERGEALAREYRGLGMWLILNGSAPLPEVARVLAQISRCAVKLAKVLLALDRMSTPSGPSLATLFQPGESKH